MYNLPFFFHEPSFKAAKALLLDCSGHDNEHLSHASENGVLVGKLKKMAIQQYQQNDIKRRLQKMHPGTVMLSFPPWLNVQNMLFKLTAMERS